MRPPRLGNSGNCFLHTVPVFIAVLGGLTVFGVAGVVLGPVVLAIAVVLLDTWRRRMAHGHAAENGIEKQGWGKFYLCWNSTSCMSLVRPALAARMAIS